MRGLYADVFIDPVSRGRAIAVLVGVSINTQDSDLSYMGTESAELVSLHGGIGQTSNKRFGTKIGRQKMESGKMD